MKGPAEKDYCFECRKWIEPEDNEHQEHDTVINRTDRPPDLGVSVSDGIGADDIFGGQ
jgi:hypothetical protein